MSAIGVVHGTSTSYGRDYAQLDTLIRCSPIDAETLREGLLRRGLVTSDRVTLIARGKVYVIDLAPLLARHHEGHMTEHDLADALLESGVLTDVCEAVKR